MKEGRNDWLTYCSGAAVLFDPKGISVSYEQLMSERATAGKNKANHTALINVTLCTERNWVD